MEKRVTEPQKAIACLFPLLLGCIMACSGKNGEDGDGEADGADTMDPTGDDALSPPDGADVPDHTIPDAPADVPPGDPAGPLSGLPSDPGDHIPALEALGADEWLELGPPAADPEYGVARGRSWGGRALIPVPELRGAFFMGEGVHAFVKPDGRIMDDIFFYDINGHRWIAVYPGTDTLTFNDKVTSGELSIDENAQVVDGAGNPVPIHTLIHAWDFLTYDTTALRFAFLGNDGIGRYYLGGIETIEEGITELEAQREAVTRPPMSPWFYDTPRGVFDRFPIENSAPDVGGYAGFIYLASSNRFFYGGSNGVAFFDPEANSWTLEEDQGERPPGYDHGIAYDPTREMVYMGTGTADPTGGLYIYDIESAAWSKPSSSGTPPQSFRTNEASIFYDTANDVVTVFHYEDSLIYIYEHDSDSWSTLTMPSEVRDAVSYPQHHAFYDSRLNVYFLYVAGDSSDVGTMWAYRYL
jgi:hypothetical protein